MTIFDNNMKTVKIFKTLILAIFVLTAMSSCDKNRNKPGYSYFPDMEQSQAYETYSTNPVWQDGKTNQLPPEGTVPREMIPFDFEKTDVNRIWAGQELENPYANATEVLDEGKRLYDIYCLHCHGDNGDGKGHLYTSQKYLFLPADLNSEKIKSNPDGEIFHVISIGYGVMGAHAAQILPDERWKIISYIRQDLHTRIDTTLAEPLAIDTQEEMPVENTEAPE